MAKSKDVVKQIRKAIRRKFSTDEKTRIVLEGSRGETPLPSLPLLAITTPVGLKIRGAGLQRMLFCRATPMQLG